MFTFSCICVKLLQIKEHTSLFGCQKTFEKKNAGLFILRISRKSNMFITKNVIFSLWLVSNKIKSTNTNPKGGNRTSRNSHCELLDKKLLITSCYCTFANISPPTGKQLFSPLCYVIKKTTHTQQNSRSTQVKCVIS